VLFPTRSIQPDLYHDLGAAWHGPAQGDPRAKEDIVTPGRPRGNLALMMNVS
jgi:hypothetical protein